jgi:hypothetical protein
MKDRTAYVGGRVPGRELASTLVQGQEAEVAQRGDGDRGRQDK